MSYVIGKKLKGKTYFYLVTNLKISGKSKKIQVYVGRKKPTEEQLEKLKRELNKKVRYYLESHDPLLNVVSESEQNILEKVRKAYNKIKKQSPYVERNYYEWFVTTYTYNSNAIEGSSLTLRETAMVLFEGITPQGRPLQDVRAAENHKKAYDWMLSYRGDISKMFILKLHRILTTGILSPLESGKIRKVQVFIRGSEQIPPRPSEVESEVKSLLKWYKANKKRYHPLVIASYFHSAFEGIHPFVDFNGRTGRLLLNFILIKNGYPPVDIRNKNRQKYYAGIKAGIDGNLRPLIELVIGYLEEFSKRLNDGNKHNLK